MSLTRGGASIRRSRRCRFSSVSRSPLAVVRPEEARPRLEALGFRSDDVDVLAAHFLAAEERGQTGHGLSRIEWLETWESLETERRPQRVVADNGYERWDGNGALGYLVLHAIVDAQLAAPP